VKLIGDRKVKWWKVQNKFCAEFFSEIILFGKFGDQQVSFPVNYSHRVLIEVKVKIVVGADQMETQYRSSWIVSVLIIEKEVNTLK
jgi:hypothetical protein